MKYFITSVVLLLLLLAGNAYAQTVTKAPVLIDAIEAEYTEEAIENGIEGVVRLRLTISETGQVTNVTLVEGIGYGLDDAAMSAARQFVFEPAEIDDRPAAVTLTFAIDFSLPLRPGTFVGRILDGDKDVPVRARIRIELREEGLEEEVSAVIETAGDGVFEFAEVPAGTYGVSIEAAGFDPVTTVIEMDPGETVDVTYRLSSMPDNLTGLVREAGTRTPLAGVRVSLWDDDNAEELRETFTNAEGRFAFSGVDPGPYFLRFETTDYFPSNARIEVFEGERTEGTFSIEAEYYDEYTVRTRARRARTEVNRQRLELEEIRRIPGSGGDVVRVVQNLPGIARAPFLSGAIVVRGAAPQDTKIFLNGDNIPLVYHLFGGPAVINSEMIEALEFYPGNFSAYYGRATGGVIELNTRSPKVDRLHGMLEVDLLKTTALIEGPIGEKFSFALSGRRSYYDLFLPAVFRALESDIFVLPVYWDYQGWFTFRPTSDHKLELFLYGSSDRVNAEFLDGEPRGSTEVQFDSVDLTNGFVRGQARWEYRPLDSPITNTMMVAYGVNTASFEVAENFYFDVDFYISQIREDLRLEFSDRFALRTGADLLFGRATVDFRTPRFEDDADRDFSGQGEGRPNFSRDGIEGIRTSPQLQPAFYVEAEARPLKPWLLVPGLRFDYYGQYFNDPMSISPRLTTRWEFNQEWAAKGGIGLFTQPALPGSEDPTFGNPGITYEKAMQYAVGGEWRPTRFLEFDLTLFYRDIWDILSQTNEFEIDADGNTRPTIFKNDGEGRAYGAEILIRHYPYNRIFGWVAYTLSRAERLNLQTGEFSLYQFDQTHILTMVGGINLPKNWDLSARFRLVTGSPFTPVIGGAFNSEQDRYERIFGPRNSERSATFHQLDLRVDKRYVFDSWILSVYLDVQNVYNAVNAEGIRYNYDFTDSEPIRGLPILPTFGVSARF